MTQQSAAGGSSPPALTRRYCTQHSMNTNNVVLQITVPESPFAAIFIQLPHASMMDAIQYEIEEMARRQSFERRYGFALDSAMGCVRDQVATARLR